jgi:hypothetical protein
MEKSDAKTKRAGMTENAGTIHGAPAFENPGDGQGVEETLPEAKLGRRRKDAPRPPCGIRASAVRRLSGERSGAAGFPVGGAADGGHHRLGYWTLFAAREEQTLENLADSPRGAWRASAFSSISPGRPAHPREEFLDLYRSDVSFSEEEFWTYFFRDDAGAVRLRREYFDGTAPAKGLLFRGFSALWATTRRRSTRISVAACSCRTFLSPASACLGRPFRQRLRLHARKRHGHLLAEEPWGSPPGPIWS